MTNQGQNIPKIPRLADGGIVMPKTTSYVGLYKECSQAWKAVMATTEWELVRENSLARYEVRKTLNALEEKRIAILHLIEATPEKKYFDLVNQKLNNNAEYSAYIQSVMEGTDD